MARVLVIGGGIAGTATALALHKAGFDVTVNEAHPDSAEDIGAFLTWRATACAPSPSSTRPLWSPRSASR